MTRAALVDAAVKHQTRRRVTVAWRACDLHCRYSPPPYIRNPFSSFIFSLSLSLLTILPPLISIWVWLRSGVRRSIAVLPTKQLKASHPRTKGGSQPRDALKSDSKLVKKKNTQRLGERYGGDFLDFPFFFFFSSQTVLSLCEKVQVASFHGQCKFMFHHQNLYHLPVQWMKKIWISVRLSFPRSAAFRFDSGF